VYSPGGITWPPIHVALASRLLAGSGVAVRAVRGIVLFVAFQRQFVQGITVGSLK
jgi:hypothetical protein